MTNIKNAFMFSDGNAVYTKFNKKYKRHKIGYVILGPPGIGKTTFVKQQSGVKKDWIDQDDLFHCLGVRWTMNQKNKNEFKLNYLRADYMSEQSKLLGYRIIGSLFWDYKADAIVIPPLKLHKEYLQNRQDLTETHAIAVRKLLIKNAKMYKIPMFDSIESATNFLEKL